MGAPKLGGQRCGCEAVGGGGALLLPWILSGSLVGERLGIIVKRVVLCQRSSDSSRVGLVFLSIRSRPGKPNQRKGRNEKFMNFAHFCEF